MKTTILYSFVLLTMLGIGFSCKKVIEEVKPPVVTKPGSSTTPPVSTTPVATTPVSSTQPEQPMTELVWDEACQIVKTTYKEVIDNGPYINPELITVGGKTFKVGLKTITNYKYDEKGRILSEIYGPDSDSTYRTYKYEGRRVYLYSLLFNGYNKKILRLDTIKLNSQGLSERNGENYFLVDYDQDGYPISYVNFNGNYTGSVVMEQKNTIGVTVNYGTPIGTFIYRFTYDTTKLNLPVIKRYLGRESQNLPIQQITEVQKSLYYPNDLVAQINYYYQYDTQGRVKRRIAYERPLNQSWIFGTFNGGIGVTDYEYACK
jgi:hypothetical protein